MRRIEKIQQFAYKPKVVHKGKIGRSQDIVKEISESGKLESMLPKSTTATLESRLKSLINIALCMLFMKRDKSTPQYRFSESTIALLNGNNADYQTFDILKDNDVRERFKIYSDWPTYSRLYINGELIGGFVTAKATIKSRELNVMHPKTNK